MLTGDENIADVKFRVIWQIDPVRPENYAFNVRDPRETIKAVSESVMREIVGRTQIQRILTSERRLIEPAALEATQRVLNDYRAASSSSPCSCCPLIRPSRLSPLSAT